MAATVLGGAAAASAQSPPRPLVRADVSATIGWIGVDTGSGSSGPWLYHRWETSLFGTVGAGWFWTDHLKTEVDFGAGRDGEVYLTSSSLVPGQPQYRTIRRQLSRRNLGVSQQYQFFRNAWLHPHLAAGVHLASEQRTDYTQPIFAYDPVTRTSGQAEPQRIDGPTTEFVVRPFVAAGFKAYMTRRAFFRSDLRVGFKHGIDETLLRFGFGVDF